MNTEVPDVKPANLEALDAANIIAQLKETIAQGQRKEPVVYIQPPVKPKCLPIGNGKHVKVCKYRHNPYVNIRDYTTTTEGQLYATKRGILLKPEEWRQLKKVTKDVDQELKNV